MYVTLIIYGISIERCVLYKCKKSMPINGRAQVLGMEFGVGDLLLRYDFLLFLKSSGNLDTYHMERTRIHVHDHRSAIALI
jgi:hypothetical protein